MLLRSSGHYKLKPLFFIGEKVTARLFSAQKTADPLQILFCGSDDFSIASLKALYNEHKQNANLIASIAVVCRPGKRVGRGLKNIREVPIAGVARNLCLPLHELDTFTGWTPPPPPQNEASSPINLIITSSFGRLVPPRILNSAKYSGLNVHPSLLPNFHGPAPLHHTLLTNSTHTGVTVQTMHPRHFDQGVILDQTPLPGIEHNCTSVATLSEKLAPLGAEMLVRAIRNGTFIPPLEAKGQLQKGDARHAPKITPEDSHLNWTSWTADEILRRQEVVGPLWNTFPQTNPLTGAQTSRRVIWSSHFTKPWQKTQRDLAQEPGRPYTPEAEVEDGAGARDRDVYINTIDGTVLHAMTVKLDGERERSAVAVVAALGGGELE